MNEILEYNGYSGSISVSTQDNCLYGKILFINDLVTFEAETVSDLYAEFVEAVDDYIKTCQEHGVEAQKPFKGSFNIRIKPELHRQAALEANKRGISLNEFVSEAIDCLVNKAPDCINHEHHHHIHHVQHKNMITSHFEDTIEPFGEYSWTMSPDAMRPLAMSKSH